jgi:hypothetical protein
MPTAELEGSRLPVNSRWVAALLKSAFQRRPDIKQPAKPPFNVLTGRAHVIREREHGRVLSKLKIKEHFLVYLFPRIYFQRNSIGSFNLNSLRIFSCSVSTSADFSVRS